MDIYLFRGMTSMLLVFLLLQFWTLTKHWQIHLINDIFELRSLYYRWKNTHSTYISIRTYIIQKVSLSGVIMNLRQFSLLCGFSAPSLLINDHNWISNTSIPSDLWIADLCYLVICFPIHAADRQVCVWIYQLQKYERWEYDSFRKGT